MGLPIRFLPHSVYVNTVGGTTAWINGVENLSPESGVTLFEETTGSATDREFVAAKDIMPVLPITTSDLTALATVGFSGLAVAPGSGTLGVTAYGRELPLEAVPAAIGSSVHLSLQITDGLIVPVSIRVSHNSVARLSLAVHAILGTTPTYSQATPFVYTEDTTITSGAGQTANLYTTGPVKWTVSGGSSQLLAGINDLNVDFGIKVHKESSDGDVYPTHVSIIARNSKIMFTTKDAEQIAAIGDGISVSAFACYFRQLSSAGQRVAAATTTHIKIAGTAGMITPGSLNLAHAQSGTASFVYTPTLNTNLITVSTASAIPTS